MTYNLRPLALVPLTLVVSLAGCQKAPDAATNKKGDRPTLITSVVVKEGELPNQLSATGHVEAIRSVEIRPQLTAQIAGIHFSEGANVKAGQLLFTLDARDDEANASKSRAQTEQTAAQLREAERSLHRSQELARAKFISPSAVDTAQAKVDTLRAQLNAARADQQTSAVKLSYTRISAPFAGRTGKINVHQGSLAQTNGSEPLVTLTQLDPVQVTFQLPERELPALLAAKQQAPVMVNTTLPDGQQRAGKVTFMDSQIDKSSGTLLVKAEFANPDQLLWPGLSTTVNLDLGRQRGLVLPLQAVQTGPEQRFVYQINAQQQVEAKPVQILRSADGMALITGIKAGSKVVLEGGQNLRPGAKVQESKAGDKKAGRASGSAKASHAASQGAAA
ncbi:efflux RND transporter periplasmic adaptor subunit [Chitinibacter tainanensis]|uniref:efflux RND transporter periplasmic adaptor subunit n=1 Tax=Chitinibacter tainanensis TaxID=230667 RepID=UPI00040F3C67|nr:efflux RND transporter periplasmic adaptor subunit [Chitinibacter tainanensis]